MHNYLIVLNMVHNKELSGVFKNNRAASSTSRSKAVSLLFIPFSIISHCRDLKRYIFLCTWKVLNFSVSVCGSSLCYIHFKDLLVNFEYARWSSSCLLLALKSYISSSHVLFVQSRGQVQYSRRPPPWPWLHWASAPEGGGAAERSRQGLRLCGWQREAGGGSLRYRG